MDQEKSPITERLIAHFGGREKTAQAFGVVGETIRLWKINGIPLDRSLQAEELSGHVVTASEILEEARARKQCEARQ